MNDSATKIQAIFRGYLARRYYKHYCENKLRLAVKVQRIWKTHYAKMSKRRKDEEETTFKFTKIQAWFRGHLTRKGWDLMMKERLNKNEDYFNTLRGVVIVDSAMIIQRAWRSIVVRIRKLKYARQFLKKRMAKIIIQRWSRFAEKSKKQNLRKNLYGVHNLPPTKEDNIRKNPQISISILLLSIIHRP